MVRRPANLHQVTDAQPQLPPLSEADEALLASAIDLNENLFALAAQARLPLLHLYRWHSRPDIAAYLAAHRALVAHARREHALNALQALAASTQDPSERRRVITLILRALNPARQHASGRTQDDRPTPPAHRPRPASPPRRDDPRPLPAATSETAAPASPAPQPTGPNSSSAVPANRGSHQEQSASAADTRPDGCTDFQPRDGPSGAPPALCTTICRADPHAPDTG